MSAFCHDQGIYRCHSGCEVAVSGGAIKPDHLGFGLGPLVAPLLVL